MIVINDFQNKNVYDKIFQIPEDMTQYIKALLNKVLPRDIGEINDRMGEYRKQAKSEIADVTERRRFLRKKLDEELDK